VNAAGEIIQAGRTGTPFEPLGRHTPPPLLGSRPSRLRVDKHGMWGYAWRSIRTIIPL
jgi:hypothetical protein